MKWSDAEIDLLRRFYSAPGQVDLKKLARAVGRDKANVSRKAREMGLTDRRRRSAIQTRLRFGIALLPPEQQHEFRSRAQRENLRKKGHPRGALGMKHSPITKAVLAAKSRERWARPDYVLKSDEHRQRRSDALIKRVASGQMRTKYSRCRGGRRADLGETYFRSAWEANYARFLNWRVTRGDFVRWEYEARTFVFEAIKRGTRAYTPDFKVLKGDGSHEWHEVKGWMDQKSRTRLARMKKYYPEEKIVLVDEGWFRSARKNGIADSIPGWER